MVLIAWSFVVPSPTRSTRLSTRSTRLSTRSICLPTRSNRSTICRVFITDQLKAIIGNIY